MAEPFFSQNISSQNSSAQAYAASALMAIGDIEKKLRQHGIKIDANFPQISAREIENFISQVNRLSIIEPAQEFNSRRKYSPEEKVFRQQALHEKKEKRKKRERDNSQAEEEKAVIKVLFWDKLALNFSPIQIKEYIINLAKIFAQMPQEEQPNIRQALKDFRGKLLKIDIAKKEIISFEQLIQKSVAQDLRIYIKKALVSQVFHSAKMLDLALNKDSLHLILSTLSPQSKLENLAQLIEMSKQMGLDLNFWISYWNLEKISLSPAGEVMIDYTALENEKALGIAKDEYRHLEYQRLIASSFFEAVSLMVKLWQIKDELKLMGLSHDEMAFLFQQAKHLAWLKTIAELKELHLKRVLSSSQKDFIYFSFIIEKLTLKARRLGSHISPSGSEWLRQKLEDLAIETAQYKLDLMRSLQKLEFDSQRENDIQWIEKTLHKLQQKRKKL